MDYKELIQRTKNIINEFDKNEYPETFKMLNITLNEKLDLNAPIQHFCDLIFECDRTLSFPPPVAALIKDALEFLIEQGDDYAMNNLGALYYDGRLGEQDFNKSVYYYEMSAKLGNRQAQENLGYCYYYGRLGKPDYKKAYHYFILRALDNEIISLYKIGDMYKNGYYVDKNEKQAFSLYMHCKDLLTEKTEMQSGSDVYVRLADCFYYGIGTTVNYNKALTYYQKAEINYIQRISNGDFMYIKQYKRCIEMQNLARTELQKNIPSYSWVKKEY